MVAGVEMFEWMRQPEDRIAGGVPVDLQLAASETVVIAITHSRRTRRASGSTSTP
jgi:hypothetical protein